MKKNIFEAVVGFIVLIVVVVLVCFAYSSGMFKKANNGYVLYALFDDIGSLNIGSDVKISGIKIGAVKSLKLNENYQAAICLLINDNIVIPTDSIAEIATDGFFGNKFVNIKIGFVSEFCQAEEEIEETKSVVNLEYLINQFIIGGNKKGLV